MDPFVTDIAADHRTVSVVVVIDLVTHRTIVTKTKETMKWKIINTVRQAKMCDVYVCVCVRERERERGGGGGGGGADKLILH